MEFSQSVFRNKHWKQHVRQVLRSKKYVQGCVWVGGWKQPGLSLNAICSYHFRLLLLFLPRHSSPLNAKARVVGPFNTGPLHKQTLPAVWLEGADSSPRGSLPWPQRGGEVGDAYPEAAASGGSALWHRSSPY